MMRLTRLVGLLLCLPMFASTSGCAALLKHAEGAPMAPAHAQAKLPAPVRVVLPNGMTLLVVYRPHLPIVSINVVTRAGAVEDPGGKAGLASLTAGLLKRGTTTRTAPQIAETIDAVGGSLSTDAGLDSAAAGVNVLTKDLDLGINLLAEVLQHPAFAEPELKRLREEESAGLKSAMDDAQTVVRMALRQAVLANNPYGRPKTVSSLAGITAADVRGFYDTYYRPNNATVAVVGDLTPDQAREKFTAAFGTWQPGTLPARTLTAPAPVTGRRVVLVDMDVTQSFVQLGHPAVKRNNPDYFPLLVLNFILGGDFTSRLNMTIRDRLGLAYGAGSSFQMYREAGYFTASLNTRTATTGIQDESVTSSELETAKAFLTGSFPLRFETNQQLAGEIVNTELFGLPADYLSSYRDHVLAVSAQDVQRVARTYIKPGDYDLVVVGKAAELGPVLARFGTVETWPKEKLIR
jgi:zinc protease